MNSIDTSEASRSRKRPAVEDSNKDEEGSDRKASKTHTSEVATAASSDSDFSNYHPLNDDLLLYIFRLFVSPLGIVDGDSLKSCMRVCKKWNRAATSTTLWKIPARVSLLPTAVSQSLLSCTRKTLSIQSSLEIKEVKNGALTDSFLGFTNRGRRIETTTNYTCYAARERATNRCCYIKITNKTHHFSKMILREAFMAHFLQGTRDHFCAMDQSKNRENGNTPIEQQQQSLPTNLLQESHISFPRGAHIISGRSVFWYLSYPPLSDTYQKVCLDLQDSFTSTWPFQNLFIDSFPMDNITSQKDHSFAMMRHLRNLEGHPLASTPNAEHKSHLFRIDRWAKLVDWVMEIRECFDLEDKITFRALMYFDQFASLSTVTKDQYQLYAGTALLIAAKCESGASPGIDYNDIAFCADNTFSGSDMEQIEEELLSSLQWKLAMPTVIDFLDIYIHFLSVLNHQHRLVSMMRYLSELALQSPIHSLYLPSKTASCIIVLALHCLREEYATTNRIDLWSNEMEELTGFTWQSLEGCLITLTSFINDIQSTMPELSIIARRYRKVVHFSVALVPIPRVTSSETLGNFRGQR